MSDYKQQKAERRKHLLSVSELESGSLSLKDYADRVMYLVELEGYEFVRSERSKLKKPDPTGSKEKSVKTQYRDFKEGSKTRVYNTWLD